MEIDHIFAFVEPDGPHLEYLRSLGLVETYRRTHAGQGTQNICFCFDNMFLECLWVSNVDDIRSDAIARTRLHERSQWRTEGTCPFGIAWRVAGSHDGFDPMTWAFSPPYLPAGHSIDVSVDSDDPRQPMMFRSPGAAPPVQWAAERRGGLQHGAGLGRVGAVRMALPGAVAPSPTLTSLARATSLEVGPVSSGSPSLTMEVERVRSDNPLIICLPYHGGSAMLGDYSASSITTGTWSEGVSSPRSAR